MKPAKSEPTLSEPARYRIRVPGQIDESWSEWIGGMTITLEGEERGPPVTTLTGIVDQAALHGLLRQLYSLGLPLLSVSRIDSGQEDALDVT